MRSHRINRTRQGPLTGILLAMLLFRAYVPVGFMPASGTPFLLELCPAAAPTATAIDVSSTDSSSMDMPMGMPMSMDTPMPMPMPTPMPMPAHPHHHSDTHSQFQTCPFGSAPAAGPIAHVDFFAPPAGIAGRAGIAFETPRLAVRRASAHQPRGPPSLV